MRTSKTVNGQTYDYFWDGGRLSALTISNGSGTVIATMQFGYDDLGVPVTFNYNGTLYLYQTNLQGDVTGIYNQYGLCTYYEYDAWGKILKIDSAGSAESAAINANPLRYRGYIYDTETGFYYLQSRYYDPTVCRFINSDGQLNGGLLGNNLFAYCLNNPVMYSDPTGQFSELSDILITVALTSALVALAALTVATCGATAPALAVAGGGIVAGSVSAGTAAAATNVAMHALIIASIATAGAVAAELAIDAKEKASRGSHSVYFLIDSDGKVQYVGRTKNPIIRAIAHNANPFRKGMKMNIRASGLSLEEARALEQAGMLYHHTINTANKMNNQINGIAPSKWEQFYAFAEGCLDYSWNQMTNEILYWLELRGE